MYVSMNHIGSFVLIVKSKVLNTYFSCGLVDQQCQCSSGDSYCLRRRDARETSPAHPIDYHTPYTSTTADNKQHQNKATCIIIMANDD